MPDLAASTPKLVWRLPLEGEWPTAVVFLGEARKVAAANRGGEAYIWHLPESVDADAGTKNDAEAPTGPPPVRSLDGHENGITHLAATSDGSMLVSTSLDRTVRIWNPESKATGTKEVVLDRKTREAEAKRARSDAPLEAAGVTVETSAAESVLSDHADWVTALSIGANDQRMITGDDAANLIVANLATREPIARWRGTPPAGVCSACLSADGELAFVAEFRSRRGDFDFPPAQARIFEAGSGKLLIDLLVVQFPDVKQRDSSYGYRTKWSKFVGRGFVASAFSPDGQLLAVGQGGEIGKAKVHLIDVETGKLVRSISEHQYGVTDVAFSTDGKYLLSSGRDTTVRICSVGDGKQHHQIGKPRGGQFKDWISSFALSPDEKWLAAADISGHIQIWSL